MPLKAFQIAINVRINNHVMKGGSIDVNELGSMIESLGITLPEEKVKQMVGPGKLAPMIDTGGGRKARMVVGVRVRTDSSSALIA